MSSAADSRPLRLFEAFGVELEYMLVDATTLDVRPVADAVIAAAHEAATKAREVDAETISGEELSPGDIDLGPVSWSNELCLHVLEIKGNGPLPSLERCGDELAASVRHADAMARRSGARLMPGAMHPWMTPATEARLWPHEYTEVYRLFDQIFDCRGHGWSNLQSTHLNLPFADADREDSEFGRLHAAIRLVLPILPALAASSPFVDGRMSPCRDARLEAYRRNAARIPSVTGPVIPEPVFTQAAYDREIYQPIAAAMAPHDPQRLLNPTWVNARGAIARFDRGAIEIRLLDVQECPAADLAILATIVAALRELVAERWCTLGKQQAWAAAPLAALLDRCIRDAESAMIDDPTYLAIFGLDARPRTAGEMWREIVESAPPPSVHHGPLDVILDEGTLATRMLRLAGPAPDRGALRRVGAALADALLANRVLSSAPHSTVPTADAAR